MQHPTRLAPRQASSPLLQLPPPMGPRTIITRLIQEGPPKGGQGPQHPITKDFKSLRVAKTIHLNSICLWDLERITLKEISKSIHNKISNSLRHQGDLGSTKTNQSQPQLRMPGKLLSSIRLAVTSMAHLLSILPSAIRAELPILCRSNSRTNRRNRVFSSARRVTRYKVVLRLPTWHR